MSFLTKSEFARKCGRPDSRWLYPYVKKGQVVLSGDYVDTNLPINQAFYEKWTTKGKSKRRIGPPQLPDDTVGPNIQEPDYSKVPVGYNDIDKLELRKKQVELELAEEKLRKVKGEVVPVGLVKSLFQQFGKSSSTSFSNAADNLIQEFQKKFDMSRKDMADLRERLVEITNEAIDEAADDSISMLKAIVEEYSQKRGIGERS
jgi:hypothetical protein